LKIGEASTIKIFINTEEKEINVIEGKIKINGPAKIEAIDTRGSIFSLWPEEPKLLNNQEINFTGGIPGGVYGKDLRLFNFTIVPMGKGEITIEPVGIMAYLNDGKGTKIKNENSNITIQTSEKRNLAGRVIRIILIMVVLFTLSNILRKIFKAKNK
jgi:hypothetical protein